MEECLAKAESDNFLNSRKESEMDHSAKIKRLKTINKIIWTFDQEWSEAEELADEPSEIMEFQWTPETIEEFIKYNADDKSIKDLRTMAQPIRLKAGKVLRGVLNAMRGLLKKKMVLMANLSKLDGPN